MTNGILLLRDKSLYDKLSENDIDEIRISRHYGIASDLDSAPIDISSEVCVEAKNRNFRVGFMEVVTDDNYNLVKEMCIDAYVLDADSVGFINYVGSKRLNGDKRQEFFDSVQNQRKIFEKEELEILLHGDFGPRLGSKGEKLEKYCPAVHEQVVITPNNKIFGCPFLLES